MKATFKQIGKKVEALLTAYEGPIVDALSASNEAKVSFSARIFPGGKAVIKIKAAVTTINDTTDVQPELPGVE
jgi:hypothetical protein